MSAIKINPETLEPEGTVIMPGAKKTLLVALFKNISQKINHHYSNKQNIEYIHCHVAALSGQHSDGQNIIFTDGEYINQIAACKDVSLILRPKLLIIMTISTSSLLNWYFDIAWVPERKILNVFRIFPMCKAELRKKTVLYCLCLLETWWRLIIIHLCVFNFICNSIVLLNCITYWTVSFGLSGVCLWAFVSCKKFRTCLCVVILLVISHLNTHTSTLKPSPAPHLSVFI